MEKILLVQDAHRFKRSAIDFACYLARLTRSRLTGVFLEDVLSDRPAAKAGYGILGATVGSPEAPSGSDAAACVLPGLSGSPAEENIRYFREACVCREVVSRVHRDRGVPLDEAVAESRFADLIVVDAETSFSNRAESLPGRFLNDMLAKAECPVVIAPDSFDEIGEIDFAYNGTASSVFAIKQFTYLFPELKTRKVNVVSARQDNEEAVREAFKMKEWLKEHYDNVEFHLLKGDVSDQLFAYLLEKKNTFVVMGAYGRGIVSRFFKPSHARLILRTMNLPIFIAHQ